MNQEIRNYVMQKMSPFLDNGQTLRLDREIMVIDDAFERFFYETECINPITLHVAQWNENAVTLYEILKIFVMG